MVEPSIPRRPPWEEWEEVTKRLDRLIAIWEKGIGIPGPPGLPGAPGTVERLVSIISETVPEALGPSAVIPFQKSVAASYQDEQERIVPFNGTVRDVIMAFPAGCQQLVEVRLLYITKGGSRIYIVPTLEEYFIALDDFTAVFHPHYLVQAPGNFRVEWYNYDSLNAHSVPVVVTLTPTRLEIGE